MNASQQLAPAGPGLLWPSPGDELLDAAELQRRMLPPCVHRGARFELAAVVRPCHPICGDFFDYVDGDGELRVVVGDVCRKGAPAALQAAAVQGILSIEAEADGGPASIVRRLNRTLCRRIPESCVTLFYAIVTNDHRLVHCSAGHCRSLLITQDEVQELGTSGPPVGICADSAYEEGSVVVHEGDMLLVVSDGIVEARRATPRREEFGDRRLLDIVRAERHSSAPALLDLLLAGLSVFTRGGAPQDDMTAVVVRCLA